LVGTLRDTPNIPLGDGAIGHPPHLPILDSSREHPALPFEEVHVDSARYNREGNLMTYETITTPSPRDRCDWRAHDGR
jgi:hypothetical protein